MLNIKNLNGKYYFNPSSENIVPIYLNKLIIVKELCEVIDIIKTNLFFNQISIKSIITENNNNFITPKFEIVFTHLQFKTVLLKELTEVIHNFL